MVGACPPLKEMKQENSGVKKRDCNLRRQRRSIGKAHAALGQKRFCEEAAVESRSKDGSAKLRKVGDSAGFCTKSCSRIINS